MIIEQGGQLGCRVAVVHSFLLTSATRRQQRDAGQYQRDAVGGGVVQHFDLVIEGDGQHLGLARNIATDHQHNAELAHSVREA